jgi:uncharacterized protein YqjF (DUF2071 family)
MTEFIKARWENLVMINYAIDPDILKPFLPDGVELDYFQGKTYVSLVGFMFKDTRIFNIPIPYMGSFEEINLRFYVKRQVNNEVRRGVVFVSEIIPSKLVAFTANLFYKEHYKSHPTSNKIILNPADKKVEYKWKVDGKWNRIYVEALSDGLCMRENSMEHFIFDHYYGYSKLDGGRSLEYSLRHPQWLVHHVKDFDVQCNFQQLYGDSFKVLDKVSPQSVMIAEGSDVSVEWRRNYFRGMSLAGLSSSRIR